MNIEFKELDIIEERHEEIEKLNKDLIQIRDIMNILSSIIEEDNKHIENVRQNVELTNEHAKQALTEIKKASALQKQTICTIS